AKPLLGGGIPADIRNAGQYTAWKRMMSLPIMCRSAGQNLRKSADDVSGKPTPVREFVSASTHTYITLSGWSGTGTPQSNEVREIEKSRRPPDTKLTTSLRRTSGPMNSG